MPRVALHPDDRRSKRFPVSLSPSEAELIEKAAAATFDSVAEFIRIAAKEKAQQVLQRKPKGGGLLK